MSRSLVEHFLRRMLGTRWPKGFSDLEQRWLIADTTLDEVILFHPEYVRTPL